MLVITRNDKTTVVKGWRAWLAGAVALVIAWIALAFVAFVWIGLAVTIGIAVLILVPAITVVAIVASFLRR